MGFLSRNIILVSLVSLFTDLSSEMLYPIMPLYLSGLGMGAAGIGLLEGIAEAVAGLSKGFFGALSDRSGERKRFITIGYLMSACSKPMMGLMTIIPGLFAARSLDRLGKGVRTAARDALLADESEESHRGRVFGFHRSMDTLGAAIGPLFTLAFLHLNPGQYKALFLWAFIPGLMAVVLTLLIRQRKSGLSDSSKSFQWNISFLYVLSANTLYKRLYFLLFAFALVNSTDLFILLKMKNDGIDDTSLLAAYIGYNLLYALLAYPAGIFFDRFSRSALLSIGFGLFSAAYLLFGIGDSLPFFIAGFMLYAAYAACTEGVSKAWITTLIPPDEKATALGNLMGMQALAAPLAGLAGGWLWEWYGPLSLFAVSAVVSLVLCIFLLLLLPAGREVSGG